MNVVQFALKRCGVKVYNPIPPDLYLISTKEVGRTAVCVGFM